jgi:hypothetical protein
MALACQMVEFVRLGLKKDSANGCGVIEICVMQKQSFVIDITVMKQLVKPYSLGRTGTTH